MGKRYDLEKLPERLLVSPPPRIGQHIFKDEVINYVLDKAFLEQPLKAELVLSMELIFAKADLRDIFVSLMEKDYKAY